MDLELREVLGQLKSHNAEERLFSLVYIARMNLQSALLLVIEALADEDLEVRTTAAWALDLMGNPAAIPPLVSALHDTDYHVRSTAGWALTHLGEPAIPYVLEVLQHSSSLVAREMAYQILARTRGEQAYHATQNYQN